MRIAVLADIHGNLLALEAVLSHLEAEGGAEEIWVLGDLAVFCPYPVQVLDRLAALPSVRFLQGNTDRYLVTGERPRWIAEDESQWKGMAALLRERDANFRWTLEQLNYEWYSFLRDLPYLQRSDVADYGAIIGVHASFVSDELGVWAATTNGQLRDLLDGIDARLLLCGHTHHQLDRRLGQTWVVNPGSVGLPLDGDQRAAYGVLEFVSGDCQVALHRVDYDVGEVIAKLDDVGHPAREWAGTRLRLAAHP